MRTDYSNEEVDTENSESNGSESASAREFTTEQSGAGYLETITETDREYIEESCYMSNQHMDTQESKEPRSAREVGDLEEKKKREEEKSVQEVQCLEDGEIPEEERSSVSPKMRKLDMAKLPLNLDTQTVISTATKTNRETVQSLKILTYPEENYEGEVDENFVRNGYGIYQYENGDIYEGEFENGLRSGEGEYTYEDGSLYRGYWLNDKKHGKGTFKFDKYEFDGEWVEDTLLSGFTFKINQFNQNADEIDEEDDEYLEDYSSLSHIERDSQYSSDEESTPHNKLVEIDRVDEEKLRDFILRNKKRFGSYKVDIELVNVKNEGNKTNLINHLLDTKVNDFDFTDISTASSMSIHDQQCPFHRYMHDFDNEKCDFKCNCKKFRRNSLFTNKLCLSNFNSN